MVMMMIMIISYIVVSYKFLYIRVSVYLIPCGRIRLTSAIGRAVDTALFGT